MNNKSFVTPEALAALAVVFTLLLLLGVVV